MPVLYVERGAGPRRASENGIEELARWRTRCFAGVSLNRNGEPTYLSAALLEKQST